MNVKCTIALLLVSLGAWAGELLPELNIGDDTTVKFKAYGQMLFTERLDTIGGEDPNDLILNRLRLRTTLESGAWGFFNETSFVMGDKWDDNWLRETTVSYKLTDNWKLRAGRLFLSAGCITPPPFLLETIEYPMDGRFGLYAWGVQVEGNPCPVLLGGSGNFQAEFTGFLRQRTDQSRQMHHLHTFLSEDALQIEVLHVQRPADFAGPVVMHTRAAAA